MKNVQYQIGSNAVMLTADISGRWGLSCPAAIEIVNGVCSVGLATPKKTLTSDNWNLISVKKGNRRDEYGLLDTIAMEFSAPESLIIVWEGGVYAERGVVVCQMTIKNIGSHDLFVDSLSPFFARSEKGSVLYLNGSPDGVVRALHNNMWMGGNLRPVYIPDDRGMQKDYHVTALSRESGGCLVAGMGERANTVPLFGWARRGHGFEFMAGGLTMVNRRYTPLRIRPGTGFTMNRLTLVPGVDPYACFETYGDYLATYTHTNLDKKPYTGIFCGYGQDVLERKDWFHYPLTVDRIKELMEITDKYLAPYGIDYIKTQFGGLSSGPAGMVFEKRDWSDAPVFPEANSPEELAAIIEEKSFTPDTYNLKDYMPDGVAALSREVHGRGYRHALVCRPFLNVEAGSAKLDRYAAEVFGMCSDKWGYDYLMFDFISADFENDLDDTVTMAQSISNRFQAVRERVGKHIFIEACMSMPGPVIGIVDGYRPACDWRGGLEPDIAGELLSYYYLHGKIFQMDLEFFDPDVSPMIWEGFGPENGTRPLHGSLDRVKQWVSFSGLTGYSYLTGGVIDRVSPERWRIFSRAMPIYGKAARPLDLMSADRVSLLVLEAQDCVHSYTAAGLFNWSVSIPMNRTLRFIDIGLEPGVPYVLYDFWDQRCLGVYTDEYIASVSPGSCLVLHAHRFGAEPLCIGNDRHVTGVIGLTEFGYDKERYIIEGVTEGPAGTEINHYIYIPSGQGPKKAEMCSCEAYQPNVLRVTASMSVNNAVKWRVFLSDSYISI